MTLSKCGVNIIKYMLFFSMISTAGIGQGYSALKHIDGLVLQKNNRSNSKKKITPETPLTFTSSSEYGGEITSKSIVGYVKGLTDNDRIEVLPIAITSEIIEGDKVLNKEEKYAREGEYFDIVSISTSEYNEVLYTSKSRYAFSRVSRAIRLSTGAVGLATIPFLDSEKSRSNATSYVNPNVTKGLLIGFGVGIIMKMFTTDKSSRLMQQKGSSNFWSFSTK